MFKFTLAVVDDNAVIILVEAMSQCDDGWLINVPNVAGSLSGLCSLHRDHLVDVSEGVDHDFTFHGLDGVDDNGNSTLIEHFLTLLSLNICSRQPGAESGMRMIPSHDVLILTYLLHHVHKLLLVFRIDSFNGDCGSGLRH